MPLVLRQSLQLPQHRCHALRLIQSLVGRNVAPNQTLRKPNIELLRSNSSPAIQRQIPCDPHQPDTHLANLTQLVLPLQHADEAILHHILGLSAAAENRVRHAKEQPGVRLNKRREIDFVPRTRNPR